MCSGCHLISWNLVPVPGHSAQLIPRLPGLYPPLPPPTPRPGRLRGSSLWAAHTPAGPMAAPLGRLSSLGSRNREMDTRELRAPDEGPLERGLAICGEPADPPHPFPGGGQDPLRESRWRTVPTYPPGSLASLAGARCSPEPPGDQKFRSVPWGLSSEGFTAQAVPGEREGASKRPLFRLPALPAAPTPATSVTVSPQPGPGWSAPGSTTDQCPRCPRGSGRTG